ncbi:MAG: DUF268 domain-containing protein [Chlamydiota bacterium]
MRLFFVLLSISNFLIATPPTTIPQEYYQEFTMDGTISVSSYYFDNSISAGQSTKYSYDEVEALKRKALLRREGYYGPTDRYLYAALDCYASQIQGKRVGIIGSALPWYEAIVLVFGGFPISIDYNKILSDHPEIKTLTIPEYDENPELFDAILSISSFEHDGLGRYGDPINPQGDLDAMKKTVQMLKPNGLLFLAVPVGMDHIFWNAHRIYGKKRLPLLLKEWNTVATFGYEKKDLDQFSKGWHQPVFVLSPK